MSQFKRIFYGGASLVPASLLKRARPTPLVLPYHHLVSDERVPHIEHIFPYKNQKQFLKDLDYLLKEFTPIHPIDLLECLQSARPIPRNTFLMSFDDGLREVYEVVAPLLTRKGIPCLFFINPAYLNNQDLFFRFKASLIFDKLLVSRNLTELLRNLGQFISLPADAGLGQAKSALLNIPFKQRDQLDLMGESLGISFPQYLHSVRPYLDSDQVRSMISSGFHFGAHSWDHPNYKYLDIKEQISQTIRSVEYVKQEFDLNYSFFSFPHEDAPVSQAFFDHLEQLKPRPVDIFFGTQNQRFELNNRLLHRFNAERPEYPIEGLVKGVLLYNAGRKLLNRQQLKRN